MEAWRKADTGVVRWTYGYAVFMVAARRTRPVERDPTAASHVMRSSNTLP